MRISTLAIICFVSTIASLPTRAHAVRSSTLEQTATRERTATPQTHTTFKVATMKKRHGGRKGGVATGIGIAIGVGKAIETINKNNSVKRRKRRKTTTKKKRKTVPRSNPRRQTQTRKRKLKNQDIAAPLPVRHPKHMQSPPVTPVAFTPATVDTCHKRTFLLSSDSDYVREKAAFAQREANNLRKSAERWREIAGQAADGAKAAGANGLESSREFQERKADELLDRANDYDARADAKLKEAQGLRRQADKEDAEGAAAAKHRCKTKSGNQPVKPSPSQPVRISVTPNTVAIAVQPKKQVSICGPDITANVFSAMDKMYRDWKAWSEEKQTENCRSLLNPATAESAWDITQLAPGQGYPTRSEYKAKNGSDRGYDRHIKWAKFWFEEQAPMCGKPRAQCANTVTFLGKCIDPQIVNYVQWGSMAQLCDYDSLISAAHSMRATIKSTPDDIYAGQRAMSAVGRAYTAKTRSGEYFVKPKPYFNADPGAWPAELQSRRDAITDMMRNELAAILAKPELAPFLKHGSNNCAAPCPMTRAAREKMSKLKFRYEWNK